MSKYTILHTEPHTYFEPGIGVVSGVQVQFRIDDYNEFHFVNIPKMDTKLAVAAVESYVKERDLLAGKSPSESK